jgi:serine/threonine protein kinase
MPADDTPLPDFESAAWEKVEQRVRAFESALARGESPRIDDYLVAPEGDRVALLAQLVCADLEFRLKTDTTACVENYVQRFPELQQRPDTVADLVATELRLRQGSAALIREYLQRFPEYKSRLETLQHGTTANALDTQREQTPNAQETLSAPPARSSQSASTTDRYEPIRFHARGGLGEIHTAHDKELHREVAIKRIHASHAHDAEIRRRFLLEAAVTARLQHPGVVPVYSLTEDASGAPCYAMRFIEGESLHEAVERFHKTPWRARGRGERALELRQLLGRFIGVCNTVAFAHSRGILHRDLKPGNIMLGKYGETLVVDWGLARGFEQAEKEGAPVESAERSASTEASTMMGRAMGTLPFMSPEQAAGRWDVIGPASDIYSLGATLYTILCGTPPIHGADEAGMKERAIRGDYKRPRQQRPDIPRALEAICLKAMALPIDGRYSSALELAQDVEHWLADEPVAARRETPLERAGRWARRHGKLSVVAGSCFILLAVSLAAVSHYRAAAEQLPLLKRFHEELDAGDWTAAHLEQMESLLASLAELSLSQAAEERSRLTHRLGDHIRKTLARPALKDHEVFDLEAALRLLEARDAENSRQLRRAFNQRKGEVEPVLDLGPPYTADKLRAALGPLGEDLRPAADGSHFLGKAGSDPTWRLYTTAIPCRGEVMMSASFHETALLEAKEIGIALNCKASGNRARSPQDVGYLFVLSSLSSARTTPTAVAVSRGEASRNDSMLRMRIERNGTVLRQEQIRAPGGPIVLHAQRAGDHLLFQVNGLQPVETQDVFPLRDREPTYFAWVASPEAGIESIHASSQLQMPEPTEIERGDSLYAQRQFAAAQAHYLEAARQLAGTEAGQEALCKQGFCSMAMNRTPEATKIYESLAVQGAGRWPLIAACQLWLYWIGQNRFDEASALLERVTTHYSSQEVTRYLAEGTRDTILQAYEPRTDSYNVHRPDQGRLQRLQQLLTVQDVFNAPPSRRWRTKLHLVLVYEVTGELDRAFRTGRELLKDPSLSPAIMRSALGFLIDGLLESDPAAALALIDEHLFESPGKYHPQRLYLLPYRASTHATLDRWDLTARDLDDYFRLANFDKNFPQDYLGAYLIKGFLLERKGDVQGAKAAWTDGYRKLKGTTGMASLEASILASLTNELTEEDTAKTMEAVAARSPVQVPIYSLAKSGLFPLGDVTVALRSMWNAGRGRDYARKIAFHRLPLRDCLRAQMMLTVFAIMRLSAFGGSMSADEDATIWQLLQGLYDAWAAGKIQEESYFRLVVTWLGVTNQFGWDGVAAKFPRELRGPLEYSMARRYAALGARARCKAFLQAALRDAGANQTLERLVRTQLTRFDSK